MNHGLIEALEAALRLRNRFRGIGRYTDPWKHFGPGGLPEAELRCEQANRDLLAYLRPPREIEVSNLVRRSGSRAAAGRVLGERIVFDSPVRSGVPENDRVYLELWRSRARPTHDQVVIFHHPVYQYSRLFWRWFLRDLIERVPVALMAAPYHFERTPPGWFPGEGTINPNPARLFEAIRQWFADQKATAAALRQWCGLRPAAVIGFSLGGFQSLLAASAGELDLPVVSISSTNRYAYGLIHGVLGQSLISAMREVGIDEARLHRMVDSLQLERYVPRINGQAVLYVTGDYDRVDPPPSLERLEQSLRPTQAVHFKTGHGTITLYRRRILGAILEFLAEQGVLGSGLTS